jgi:DnaJ-class molecular chaperone
LSELGSIFDDLPVASGDKGPDVRVTIVVRRAEVEAGQAVLVPVPDHVPFAGGTVPRRREAGDPPGAVRLHLSPRLVAGSTLRLRRQGGEHPVSGVPGDLLVDLDIVAPPRRSSLIVVVAAVAAAAAVVWWSHGVWWGG